MATIRIKLIHLFLLSLTFTFFSLFFPHPSIAEKCQEMTIRVGVYDNPPQIYKFPDGQVAGIFSDLLEVIAREKNWDIEYVFTSWEQCLKNLETGNIDLMIDIAFSTERKKIFSFSKETITTDWATVYTSKTAQVESLLDLDGKTIAVVKEDIHTNGDQGIIALAKRFNLNVKYLEVNSYLDVLKALETKKADAGIVNRIFGSLMEKKFDIKPSPIIFNPVHLKFAHLKGNDMAEVVEYIDHRIKEMKDTPGSIFHKIINSYLAGAEYDLSDFHDIKPFKITEEEQAWLHKHPTVRMGVDPNFPPYSSLDENGNVRGLAIDTISLIAHYLGIELIFDTKSSWQETITGIEDRSIDAVLTILKTEKFDKYLNFTDVYLPSPLVIMTRVDEQRIEGAEDLYQKRVCLIKGQASTQKIIKNHPSAIPVLVDTPLEGLQALSLGRADCYIGELGHNYYQLTKNGITNLKIASRYDMLMTGQSVGIRKDWPEFASILNKGLNAILEKKKLQLHNKWLPKQINCDDFESLQEQNVLTPKETEWVKKHPNIRLGIDPEFTPYEFLDSEGRYQGIASEYIRILNKRLGLNMTIVPGLSWKEAVEKAQKKEIDVLPCVTKTVDRESFLNFSEPYLRFNRVIITRTDNHYVNSIDSIKHLRVAVQQATAHEAYLKENTTIQGIKYPSIIAALKAVSNKEVDVMIGDLASTMFWIRQEHLLNLKIAGLIKSPSDQLRFASRKDWPEFTSIINKGLASISPSKRKKIHEKWVDINFDPAFDPQNFTNVVKALFVILIVLVLFTVWILLLRKEIQRRESIEASLKNRLDLEELLSEIAAGFITIKIEEVDNAIKKSLRQILNHLAADSGYIFSYIDNKKRLQLSHYWSMQRQNYPEIKKTFFEAEDFPKKLCTGDPAFYRREYFSEEDITHPVIEAIFHNREVAVIPIPYGNELAGMLWITSKEGVKGHFQDLPLLKTIGFLFGNTLHRIEMENQLAMRQSELEKKVQDRTEGLVKSSQRLLQEVSDRRKALEEKEQLQAQLLQARKLESIGTLAGGIAHDFNNILSAILGFTELALEYIQPEDQKIKDYLSRVQDAGLRAKSLVQQILTFGRQTNGIPERINPVELIDEVIQMLRPSLPTTIEIVKTIDDTVDNIFIDPTQFNQILMNLCTNAFHAMEEQGGILTIELSNIDIKTNSQHIQPGIAGNYVQLSVSNTGPAIDESIRDKIFDPYFTTKKAGKGTGMGLSIVHGIVTNCGGALNLESSPEKGTSFHIFFPACEKQPQTSTIPKSKGMEGAQHILFVDDEEFILQFNAERLKLIGFRVTTCGSGQQALDLFKANPKDFDLVITDQTMPGITGAELAEQLLQIRPDLPIILCTGYSSIINREKAKELGIKEFALKPVSTEDLVRIIKKVLDTSATTSTSSM